MAWLSVWDTEGLSLYKLQTVSSSCIFSSAFFPGNAFSSTFCVSSFSSEALGFSTGNTHVVTVTALRISSPFASLHSVRSLSLPSPCLCLLCWLFLACWAGFFATGSRYWFLGLFSGGLIVFWVCLGFLLPPCAFCGLPILLCDRAKGWDGDAGDV